MFIFKETNKFSHIKYAFFSRKNGVSKSIYNSLNCGFNSLDKKEFILKNRDIALRRIKLHKKLLIIPNQIHSNKVKIVNEKSINVKINADALLTKSNKIVLGILTADCAPIFLFDKKKKIVCAIHAGWKGAKNGIIENSIKLMLECGSKLDNIISCVGPCIGKESYNVKYDFYKEFILENKNNKKFFLKKKEDNNLFSFDLKSYIVSKMKIKGIKKIFSGPFDTFKDKENFFSFRRSINQNQRDYGRCISVISIN